MKYNFVNNDAGEWWKSDVEAVIDEAMILGTAPNVSDAHTINGHPGPMSNCFGHGKSSTRSIQ